MLGGGQNSRTEKVVAVHSSDAAEEGLNAGLVPALLRPLALRRERKGDGRAEPRVCEKCVCVDGRRTDLFQETLLSAFACAQARGSLLRIAVAHKGGDRWIGRHCRVKRERRGWEWKEAERECV